MSFRSYLAYITKDEAKKKEPSKLPKTGNNIYVPIMLALIATTGSYIYIKKRN